MRKYKHLFFDLDNTLFDFGASEKIVLRELYKSHLDESEFASFEEFYTIYESVNGRLWSEYREHKINKEMVKYGRFQETLLQKNINDQGLARFMGNSFVKKCTDNDTLVEGAKDVITALYEKYDLHIVSNGFVEAQYRKLDLTGLRPYFKGITLSEEIKTQKPNRQFFEHALKTVNARKSESLVIGDSWESDIEGAINFGIEAIYFSYYGDKPKKSGIKTIFKLNELLSILD